MSLVEIVEAVCKEQMMELAETIEGELKAECPVGKTGEARASIGITPISDTRIRIGGENDHLYYSDQGSGATKKYIAFEPKGGINHSLRPYAKPGESAVRSFGRKAIPPLHFVRKVADRHR